MALKELRMDFEHYKVIEFDRFAIASYNAIHGTEFKTTDIRNVSGADLGICNTDKFCYVMTYSFPCQDLSVAGKQKGMTKGSGTRSGLLWEVERPLNECSELPQVLLMENVPQVHSKANMPDFQKWIDFLESKGYSNYWQDLNAKDYGVAQNRDRTFMVSILGEWNYKFPQPIPLKQKLKDCLEDEVDEKYYINTEKAQKLIQTHIENEILRDDDFEMDRNFQRGRVCIDLSLAKQGRKDVANCITAHISKDGNNISNRKSTNNGVVEKTVGMKVKQIGNMDTDRENFENPQCGRVYDSNGLSPTINTCQGGQREPKIIVGMRGRNPDNLSDRTAGSLTEQRLELNSQGIRNTQTSVQKDNLLIKQATSKGYVECEPGGIADLNYPNSKTRRGRVKNRGRISPTITAELNGIYRMESQHRIRKLTPLECWRLMGFSDKDFYKAEKVNSNSQLYKQAGNSIVKNVLIAIFGQMKKVA